jgi:hypothetical protein
LAELLQAEEEFPSMLPHTKDLYADFYNEMMDLTKNIVCKDKGQRRMERREHACFTYKITRVDG